MTESFPQKMRYGALGSVGRKVLVALVRRNDESVFAAHAPRRCLRSRRRPTIVIDEVSAHIKRSRTDSELRDDE